MVKALMRKRLKLTKNQKGMTLIELMAVVVIIGILAAVAGTAVLGSFDKAKTNTDATAERVIEDAAQRYLLDNPADTPASGSNKSLDLDDLIGKGYLKEKPKRQTKDAADTDIGKVFATVVVANNSNKFTYTFTYETP